MVPIRSDYRDATRCGFDGSCSEWNGGVTRGAGGERGERGRELPVAVRVFQGEVVEALHAL